MPKNSRSTVFRVSGLPLDEAEVNVGAKLLDTINALLTDEERKRIEVLVSCIPSCEDDQTQSALVDFKWGIPGFLSELGILEDFPIVMGENDINFDRHFFGFTQLYSTIPEQNITADIIAITGLDGHAYGSWRGKDNLGRMWLRDFLSKDLPNCRTMIYGYNSKLSSHGVDTIMDYGRDFFEGIKKVRYAKELRERPLIFIAHSFGGIILAHCLVKAVQTDEQDHAAISALHRATYGMLFFGTPHRGLIIDDIKQMVAESNITNSPSSADQHGLRPAGFWTRANKFLEGSRDSSLLSKASESATAEQHPRMGLLQQIERESDLLKYQLVDFKNLIGDRKIVSFYETLQTKRLQLHPVTKSWGRTGDYLTAVDSGSALLDLPDRVENKIPVNADHSHIVKFVHRKDNTYTTVIKYLKEFDREAGEIVSKRFLNASHTIGGNVHWIVPRPLNNLFTGRSDVLLRMEKALYGDHIDKQKRFVITGMGGQGKSEICLKFASQAREKFWGIFWVDVSQPSAAERDFITIAKVLGRSVESVHDALQVLANTKENWLLILDNADDPGFDYQCYLPSGTMGSIIMTSRIPDCRQYSPDAAEALGGLDNSQSIELLLKAAKFPMETWPSHNDHADEIIRLLGSHTLALIAAGAYIANGHCQLHQYPEIYQRQRKRALKYGLQQAQSRYGDVYATFEASANVLEQSQDQVAKDALSLLEILSMLDSSVLPLQIFQEAWKNCGYYSHNDSVEEANICEPNSSHVSLLPSFIGAKDQEWDPYRLVEASSLLVSLSLATRHDLEGSIGLSMHPLTHAWAKERQNLEQQGISWIAAGCVLVLAGSADYWKTQGRIFLPHILSFLDMGVSKALSFGPKATIVPIFRECGWALHYLRLDSTLGRLLEEIFVRIGQSSEEPSIDYLPFYRLRGRNLNNLGKIKLSVQLLEKVVKIEESEFAEDNPNHLTSQVELAHAYSENGQVSEAIQLLEKIVRIEEMTLAEDNPDRLASQHELARAYKSNGQAEEAIKLLEHVVKIRVEILAEDHPDRLASQHELAHAYKSNGQVQEAVHLLEIVVEIDGTSLAEDHPSRLTSQHELARAYMSNGQVEEAIELLEQVVRIRRFTLNETHPDRLVSEEVLASLYVENGRAKEAVEILEQVIKMRMLKEDSKFLTSQHNLACAYMSNGQEEEAIKLMEHVVKIEQSTLDEGDPDRVVSEEFLTEWLEDTRPAPDGNTASGMGDACSETDEAGLASRSLGPNTTGPELIL